MFRSYFDRIRRPGEEVLKRLSLHWFFGFMVWAAFALALGALIAAYAAVPSGWQRMVLLVLTVLLALFALYRWLANASVEAVISTDRIVHKRGFIARTTEELGFRRVSEVQLVQTLLGRIFGYGTLRINAIGDDVIELRGFGDPFEAKRALDQMLARAKT